MPRAAISGSKVLSFSLSPLTGVALRIVAYRSVFLLSDNATISTSPYRPRGHAVAYAAVGHPREAALRAENGALSI